MKEIRATIKKKQIGFFLFLVAVMLFGIVNPALAGDYSSQHTYPNETLEKLIQIRAQDNQYDKKEAQAMIDRMSVFPERMMVETEKAGAKLIFTDGPLTDLPEFANLQGEILQGWEETGLTWDDVPGVGGDISAARIGHSDPGTDHSTANLEYHEFSHGIDYYLLDNEITEMDEFIDIYQEEKSQLFPDILPENSYYDVIAEYFAEAMAYYYLGNTYKSKLAKKAPKTYQFIDTLNDRILSADKRTATSVNLSWEKIEAAEAYDIYREDERIATIQETEYKDTAIKNTDNYLYHVEAVDTSGDSIHKTFTRMVDTYPRGGIGDSAADHESTSAKNLNTPTDIEPVFNSADSLTLSWSPVDGAEHYAVYRDNEVIHATTETNYTDDTLEKNKKYTYTVRAGNENTESQEAEPITVYTKQKPATFLETYQHLLVKIGKRVVGVLKE